jgi:hypothetical protein
VALEISYLVSLSPGIPKCARGKDIGASNLGVIAEMFSLMIGSFSSPGA